MLPVVDGPKAILKPRHSGEIDCPQEATPGALNGRLNISKTRIEYLGLQGYDAVSIGASCLRRQSLSYPSISDTSANERPC